MTDHLIYIDTREQRPIPLPSHLVIGSGAQKRTVRVHTESRKLETGDYRTPRGTCLIERKADLRELHTNLRSSDKVRFLHCLDRLAACDRPVLLLEDHSTHPSPHFDPLEARWLLLEELRPRGIELLVLPVTTAASRRLAGEWIAALLISEDLCPPPVPSASPSSPPSS